MQTNEQKNKKRKKEKGKKKGGKRHNGALKIKSVRTNNPNFQTNYATCTQT